MGAGACAVGYLRLLDTARGLSSLEDSNASLRSPRCLKTVHAVDPRPFVLRGGAALQPWQVPAQSASPERARACATG